MGCYRGIKPAPLLQFYPKWNVPHSCPSSRHFGLLTSSFCWTTLLFFFCFWCSSLKPCNWSMTIPTGLILALVDIPFKILIQICNKCQWCITFWAGAIKCPAFPLLQIHWPVPEQRRMECLVSGKDANVSMRVENAHTKSRIARVKLFP